MTRPVSASPISRPGFAPPGAVPLPLLGQLPADLDPVYRARATRAIALLRWGYFAPTPAEAQELLDATNAPTEKHRNRNPRSFRKIAACLARLGFEVNGDTVVWTLEGRLGNGQNRLLGIVESGKPVLLACVWGVDPEAFKTWDQHARRSGGDTLTAAGYSHTKELAAALGWQHAYASDTAASGPETIPNDRIVEVAQLYPEIDEANHLIRGAYTFKRTIPPALAVFLWTHFSAKDPELCQRFFDRVFKKVGLVEDSHEYKLMTALNRGDADEEEAEGQPKRRRLNKREKVLSRAERAAICIKTWNRIRRNDPVPHKKTALVWRSTEPFPEID